MTSNPWLDGADDNFRGDVDDGMADDDSIFDDDEFWDEEEFESSGFNALLDELRAKLNRCVKGEILDELKRLRVENASLRDLKENWDARVRELNGKHARAMRELEDAKRDVIQMKGRELLDSFAVDLWGIDMKTDELPKCDKCNSNRRIITTGPNGNPIIELCECGRHRTVYSVKHSRPIKIYFKQEDGETRAAAYYRFRDDEDTLYSVKPTIADDIPFEDMERKTYGVAFTSEEKARAYCDWLNSAEKWRYSI